MANGVSQQSPAMRLRDQVEASLNARATIITGIGPRTGTDHQATFDLGSNTIADFENPLQIDFDRGPDGCYAVLVTKGNLRVFNVEEGIECPVTFPSGKSWLVGIDPFEDLRYVAAGDYLFLSSQKKTIQMSATMAPAEVEEAFIYCRASNYEDTTSIQLTHGGLTYSWRVKAPKTTGGNGPLAAANVAKAVATILNSNAAPSGAAVDSNDGTTWVVAAAPGSTAAALGYSIVQNGAIIRITRADGADFEVNCSDQDNAKKVYHIQRTVPKLTELPASFWPNSIIRVSSNAETDAPEYWVQYREKDENNKKITGYWVEVPAPGTPIRFDTQTMPWALKATAINAFEFGPLQWDDRQIGSVDTIPEPSFVGQSINDMFFVGGRLGFVTFDGCVTSRSSDQPFNFWRETSTQLLDTDPIDIISGGAESLAFHSTAVVGNEPVFFSNKTQYVLAVPSGENLSPVVADLKPSASYQSPRSARPIPYGNVCYFVGPGDQFASIHMFELGSDENRTGRAKNVSEHVPAYIKAPVKQLFGCQSENLLFCLSGEQRREVFVYQFLDTDDKGRVQSAWSLWTFAAGDQICGITVLNRNLHFLIRRGTQLHLEKMNVSSDRLVGPTADLIVMDRRIPKNAPGVSWVRDSYDGIYTMTLPYNLPSPLDSYFIVETELNSAGSRQPVNVHAVIRVSDNQVKTTAQLDDFDFVFGRAPRVYIEPSEQVARNTNGDATFADAAVTALGPILGQSAGLVMRVGSKSRRRYAKLLSLGQSLRNSADDHNDMFTPPNHYGAGTGEYIYVLRSEAEEKIPKRFFKTAGNANDILVAFENNGPLSFRIAGLIYRMAVKDAYTGT
ncbi:hypothetical protein [Rhizobium sp. 18065]|uniref:phage nozzle protein n=1 Tax=Rhizobium sp. 18065 TaxID=2681411 RepID=UPI00135BF804|nr:hypothetical protein [Rhizobium sp. 18065]